MRSKLKIIIPVITVILAVIISAVCINFTPKEASDVEAIISTAQKYLVEMNYEQAIAEFKKVIELDPMNADAYLGLAEAYIGIGDTENAAAVLEKGFELTGDERLKTKLDEINLTAETISSAETESVSETASNEPEILEKREDYADGWYSVFYYNADKELIGFDYFNNNDEKIAHADYEYGSNKILRRLYEQNEKLIAEEEITFRDVAAELEANKLALANTTETRYSDDKYYKEVYEYDENGDRKSIYWYCSSWDTSAEPVYELYQIDEYEYENGNLIYHQCYDNDGELSSEFTYTYENDVLRKIKAWNYGSLSISVFNERGDIIKRTNYHSDGTIDYEEIYTYDYDSFGNPTVRYININGDVQQSEKYTYYYTTNNSPAYTLSQCLPITIKISNTKSTGQIESHALSGTEYDEEGKPKRELFHHSYSSTKFSLIYIPSFDNNIIIDYIYFDDCYCEICDKTT